jgi:hypothetical protein
MNYTDVFLLIVLLILIYLNINQNIKQNVKQTKEGFEPILPGNLVDPNVCYPGTYWRHNTYKSACQPTTTSNPPKITTDGCIGARTPDSRYRLVCTVDEHLTRDCRLVKVEQPRFY